MLLGGCRLPTFEPEYSGFGMIAQDFVVDRLQVLAVRAAPPLALAGEPRTVEALVVAPGGTRSDVEVEFSTCGLMPEGSVGVSDVRCFDNDALVSEIGSGNPLSWDVPAIEFPDCVPFDEVGDWDRSPGDDCVSVVPLLAVATDGGETAAGANYVAIPGDEVPEVISMDFGYGPEDQPTVGSTPITSFADPTLPVEVSVSAGEARRGQRVDLEVTAVDPHYNHVAWWVDGGILDQSGRTLIVRDEDGLGHAYNRLIVPRDAPGTVTVWVVLTDWFGAYQNPPDPSHLPMSQPAWAELTLEVQP